ncbi:LapA family protein [Wenzhouxiangella marina]|uniref:Uncharacterized protein n=1 Tax=Wenzhouxiangella marina TaxID=1579979 RepID=A0A0K0XVQ5_9GAMM|nr:LapA family protein [Wenzhouxiangella marina]AKS41702.1 hypothetical protein WM2015_1330 [Wenzhouxiangella marina]MBB6086536.1 putative integral membrane protein [Wenzhouxiangella marina]
MFRWIVILSCLLAALIGLALGVMNPNPVTVSLPGWAFEMPLGSLLMLTFALGLVCGLVLYLLFFRLPARLGRRRAGPADQGRLPERHG